MTAPAFDPYALRATAADNDDVVKLALRPDLQSQLLRQFRVRRLSQDHPIPADERWNDPFAVIDFFNKCHGFGVLFDIDVYVRNSLFAKEFLDALTIWAPDGAVNQDLIFRREFRHFNNSF